MPYCGHSGRLCYGPAIFVACLARKVDLSFILFNYILECTVAALFMFLGISSLCTALVTDLPVVVCFERTGSSKAKYERHSFVTTLHAISCSFSLHVGHKVAVWFASAGNASSSFTLGLVCP